MVPLTLYTGARAAGNVYLTSTDGPPAAGGRGQVLVSYVQALGPAASNECGLLTVKVIAYTPLHHLRSTHSTMYLPSCLLLSWSITVAGVSAIL